MRKRSIFILAFLLALYIVPSILAPSSDIAARQNNPNMTREFSTSAYGDISPQSITSFSEEAGWYHDCSTNTSITASSGDTAESDGEIVTLDTDLNGGTFNFSIAGGVDCTSYPFLSFNITSISMGDGWKLEQYDGAAWAWLASDYVTVTGIYRYNIRALDTSVDIFRFTLTQTALVGIDFMKAYSIANFTITQDASLTINDYAFVDSGKLNIVRSTFSFLAFNYDPTLSLDTSIYNVWNLNHTALGASHAISFYTGTWNTIYYEEQGELENGTLSDVIFYDYFSDVVTSIEFIDTHDWQLIVSVIILFTVPIDETALNWFIIFLGLFMIPASTLYLVKGGRDNLSMNKFFFFIVAFMLGWGLLLGGIL